MQQCTCRVRRSRGQERTVTKVADAGAWANLLVARTSSVDLSNSPRAAKPSEGLVPSAQAAGSGFVVWHLRAWTHSRVWAFSETQGSHHHAQVMRPACT